ncbi:MAG: aminopeptidase P family protein [Deltaproteobacteria bacterium]
MNSVDRWPSPSPVAAFAARRQRLQALLARPALLASGWPRPRNFPHNCHPFRAESHFSYLVGRQLPGAALWIAPRGARLYATPPDPDDRLWHGPEPSLAALSAELGLEVRPLVEIAELAERSDAATLAPQDPRAAAWLSERLGRRLSVGSQPWDARDAELADALIELRLSQDEAALGQLRQAAAVTVDAHLEGLRRTRPGLREAQVRAGMEAVVVGSGMTLAYPPIVTVEGQVLHAQRQDRQLRAGELLLVDVGAETPEGWAADVTRTWPVSGRFSSTQRDVYDAVRTAQAATCAAVRPGVRYGELHRLSQRSLLESLIALGLFSGSLDELLELHAVALFYPHGVGHLLGLDVHDMEDLGDRAGYAPGRVRQQDPSYRYLRLDRDLRPGMLVTIEPGFYQIPDLLSGLEPGGPLDRALNRERLAQFRDVPGIRIEDDVLVTETGHEILTAVLPSDARALEQIMAGQ